MLTDSDKKILFPISYVLTENTLSFVMIQGSWTQKCCKDLVLRYTDVDLLQMIAGLSPVPRSSAGGCKLPERWVSALWWVCRSCWWPEQVWCSPATPDAAQPESTHNTHMQKKREYHISKQWPVKLQFYKWHNNHWKHYPTITSNLTYWNTETKCQITYRLCITENLLWIKCLLLIQQ